ncbi:MAG: hypothetical protein WC343_11820 [Bacilli bacterium]|jgi:hypothetical protein
MSEKLEYRSGGKYRVQMTVVMDQATLAANVDRMLRAFEAALPREAVETHRPDLLEAINTVRTGLSDFCTGRLTHSEFPNLVREKYADLLISDEDAEAILKMREVKDEF